LRVTVLKALLTLIKAIKVDADADAVAFNLRGDRFFMRQSAK
jgi:hypothetical protein